MPDDARCHTARAVGARTARRADLDVTYAAAPSYYAATLGLDPAADRSSLRGEYRADVAVLGGGVAGCSAALHLAKRGYRVALLEARFVGYGASGRSGGQTIFGLAASQQALEAQVGRDAARRLFDFSIEALDCTRELISDVRYRLRVPRQSRSCGHQSTPCARTARVGRRTACPAPLRFGAIPGSRRAADPRAQRAVSSRAHRLAQRAPAPAQIHPWRGARGGECRREDFRGQPGAALRDGSGGNPAEVSVHTAHGTVRCKHLVLCGNAYIGAVAPPLARRILGSRHLHRCHRASRCGASAGSAAEQCGRCRYELDTRLLQAHARSSDIVRRPRELQRHAAAPPRRVDAPAHAAGVSGTRRRQSGVYLGRIPRHHPAAVPRTSGGWRPMCSIYKAFRAMA